MKTIVVSGGTDGMGRAVALHHLRRGDTVVVPGRDAEQEERLRKFGKPVEVGIAPILAAVDEPPGVPLSAFVEGRRIGPDLDPVAAERLADLTRTLLGSHAPNLVHSPSETTSTEPATTLMAVCSSMA